MYWEVRVRKPAQKNVRRAPKDEREGLMSAIDEMALNPFAGDVQPLKAQASAFRRRVGKGRFFFDVSLE